jgi:hypothetical protein
VVDDNVQAADDGLPSDISIDLDHDVDRSDASDYDEALERTKV